MSDATAAPPRLASIDTYRGFVMTLMLAEVLRLPAVAKTFPESGFWQFLAFHQSHVDWVGCSLHDLIQPSFSFLVGVSLPFSLAARRLKGQSLSRMAGHALWRSFLLVWLGVFLRSMGRSQPNYTFEDTLSQIGLGYPFLFAIGLLPRWAHATALVAILVGYWLFFAMTPLPGADFDWASAGVKADWPHHAEGLAAHWNKNTNAAWQFDRWFMNQLPREKPFQFNAGGYSTLSFIPTLATMILGLMAGSLLRSNIDPWRQVAYLAGAGVIGLALGYGLGQFGICPVVKRIWTPSWVLFSGGWCLLILAGFSTITDRLGWQGWSYPLRVVGANSIVAYCLEHFVGGFFTAVVKQILTWLGIMPGPGYDLLVIGACVLGLYWLILWGMYRQRLFIRI